MNKKSRLKFLKKYKMYHDVINLLPIKFENHFSFSLQKDIPFKQDIDYAFNQNYNIGDDFVKNPDIIAMGCSITVPIGIPHGLSWPHLIKDELNQSLNVIAYGGGSIQRIIYNTTLHMKEYGIPKKIYFLLPSIDRCWIPQKEKGKNLPKQSDSDVYSIGSDHVSHNYYELNNFFWNEKVDNYIEQNNDYTNLYKDFLNIKRNIPLEFGIYNQIHSLITFFTMCKMLGIECFYYSWDGAFDSLLNNINTFNDTAILPKNINDHCHWRNNEEEIDFDLSYFSNNLEHQKYWKKGLDKPEAHAHPGMYTHIHYAERFLGRRLSQKTIDNAKC